MIIRLVLALTALALISPAAEARPPWALSEEGYKTARPALAPAGRAHEAIAAWDEGDGQRVVARVVGGHGRPLSPRRELAVAVGGELVGGAVVAGTRAGYLVAWARGADAIDVAALDRAGERVGPVRTIAPSGDGYLRMVYQPRAREYLVLWLDNEPAGLYSTDVLFARRLDRRGEPLGPAVMVSPRYSNIRSYAVAARRDGRGYLVAWNRDGSASVGVEARALTRRAEPAGPVRAIAPGHALGTVALAWSGRQRTFVLATNDDRDVQLYRVDPDGARRGRAHTVKPGPTVETKPFPVELAYERRSDALLVVWREAEDPRGIYGDLQARRLTAARFKTRASPPIPSQHPSTYTEECCPVVVAFRGGGYIVAWAGQRIDTGGSKIFAQGI